MQTNHSPDSQLATGPAAKSSVTLNEPRWYSILALVVSVAALIVAIMTLKTMGIQQAAWERSFSQSQEQARRTETEARVAINHYMLHTAKESANAKR